jgi:hypothetical protein
VDEGEELLATIPDRLGVLKEDSWWPKEVPQVAWVLGLAHCGLSLNRPPLGRKGPHGPRGC